MKPSHIFSFVALLITAVVIVVPICVVAIKSDGVTRRLLVLEEKATMQQEQFDVLSASMANDTEVTTRSVLSAVAIASDVTVDVPFNDAATDPGFGSWTGATFTVSQPGIYIVSFVGRFVQTAPLSGTVSIVTLGNAGLTQTTEGTDHSSIGGPNLLRIATMQHVQIAPENLPVTITFRILAFGGTDAEVYGRTYAWIQRFD